MYADRKNLRVSVFPTYLNLCTMPMFVEPFASGLTCVIVSAMNTPKLTRPFTFSVGRGSWIFWFQ